MRSVLPTLFVAITITACSKDIPRMTPFGTTAKITMLDRAPVYGELIAMQDGALIVFADSIRMLPDSAVHSVQLDISSNRDWLVPVVLFEGLPSIAGLLYSETRPYAVGLAVVTALSFAAFLGSEPPSRFDWPLGTSALADLRAHFRHPYGLTRVQLDSLRRPPGAR